MALNSFSAARIWPIECCIDPVGPTTAHPVIEAASAMPVNQYLECLVLRKPIVRNSNFQINPAGIKAQERPVAKDYCTNGAAGSQFALSHSLGLRSRFSVSDRPTFDHLFDLTHSNTEQVRRLQDCHCQRDGGLAPTFDLSDRNGQHLCQESCGVSPPWSFG